MFPVWRKRVSNGNPIPAYHLGPCRLVYLEYLQKRLLLRVGHRVRYAKRIGNTLSRYLDRFALIFRNTAVPHRPLQKVDNFAGQAALFTLRESASAVVLCFTYLRHCLGCFVEFSPPDFLHVSSYYLEAGLAGERSQE